MSKADDCKFAKEIGEIKIAVTAGCKNPANVAGFVLKPICDKCKLFEKKVIKNE